MTPIAPTWGDLEAFLRADDWRELPSGERGGSSSDHVFYETILPDGRVLQSHVSHSRQKGMSPGRFASILRVQLEVSKDEFWECIRSGVPVERPAPIEREDEVQHPAWIVAVLATDLHLSGEEIAALSLEEAERLVSEFWARPRGA